MEIRQCFRELQVKTSGMFFGDSVHFSGSHVALDQCHRYASLLTREDYRQAESHLITVVPVILCAPFPSM